MAVRNKYEVYAQTVLFSDFEKPVKRESKLLGITCASSEKQAINNIKYRLKINNSDLYIPINNYTVEKTLLKARLCQ